MNWFIFALVCILGWGFADLFYKSSSDENDRYSHLKIAVWVGLVMGVCAVMLIPFSEHGASVLSLDALVKYSPASLSYIISMIIGYAGLRYIELSVVSPIQNASGALSAIMMTVFFAVSTGSIKGAVSDATGYIFGAKTGAERAVNALIIVGIISICAGVTALAFVEHKLSNSEKALSTREKKYRLGALALLFPIAYCFFDTLGTAADGIILDGESGLSLGEFDVIILYGLTFFSAGIISWLVLLFKEKKPYNPFCKKELTKGAAALCEEFGQIFYVFAMAKKPVLAAPMIASYCIVSVILSRIILKEKLKASQYACVFSVIAGIVFLGIAGV